VEVEIEGLPRAVNLFEKSLANALPAAAHLLQLKSISIAPKGCAGFSIVTDPQNGPLFTCVPEDRAVCPKCLSDIAQPDNRRLHYPFTSCTLCGPRYTVIRAMPFEREGTAMVEFPLCEDCRHEYRRPHDRRFHAQTIACPKCGPKVWSYSCDRRHRLRGDDAVDKAVRVLAAGKIVALRGLGGYQLLVDAMNGAAVERLRERKGRRAKPLAVMARSADVAKRLVHLSDAETAALHDPSAPIVLCQARTQNRLAAAIHPHLDILGLMLPTTACRKLWPTVGLY
jgi:hydrogenase maturation protein HypF